jgi:hypothetical protein
LQEYKAAHARIEAICRSVAEMPLMLVDRKRTYEVEEFEALQAQHTAQVRPQRVSGALPMHGCLNKSPIRRGAAL